ncbi:hypothetical protein E2C01_017961 [Portunus trituberculatus]|uniref:Uncharacterized protein n=1 Tax=Portunus trituberculatus TaxID=210409 RepID=A0A5B7DUX8_PORTR|nr:hypothetical protein [Portunus trituberculatus]
MSKTLQLNSTIEDTLNCRALTSQVHLTYTTNVVEVTNYMSKCQANTSQQSSSLEAGYVIGLGHLTMRGN